MAKPVIGITPNVRPTKKRGDAHFVLSTYVAMLAQNGAIPIIAPIVNSREEAREVLDRIDALLLTGGEDIDPVSYGQAARHPDLIAPKDRLASDFAYARAAHEAAKPTLGVCLGIQIMNVAYGGTLFQDIEEDLPGAGEHEDEDLDDGIAPQHEIAIEPGTLLRAIAGTDRATVNSYHHQSVAQVAPGFRLGARASDGVIEAIERTDLPFYLGVQWHPERMAGSDLTRRLIGALADAARGAAVRGA